MGNCAIRNKKTGKKPKTIRRERMESQPDLENVEVENEPAQLTAELKNAMYMVDVKNRREVPLKSILFTGDIFASRFCRLVMT